MPDGSTTHPRDTTGAMTTRHHLDRAESLIAEAEAAYKVNDINRQVATVRLATAHIALAQARMTARRDL